MDRKFVGLAMMAALVVAPAAAQQAAPPAFIANDVPANFTPPHHRQ
ncbi:MAG: hypothetical protein K2W86_17700 [Sphingomonas sp.]|nr:hypothetical protein [Sphingomonas sp.]